MTAPAMQPLPIQYLHLETIVMPFFIGMMMLVQLARAAEGHTYIAYAQKQWGWVLLGFAVFAVVFSGLLYNVSLLLAGQLAAGFTLALLHPMNALCLFVHLLFLRPWEIATTNPLLLALPRGVAVLCLFSWLIYRNRPTFQEPQTRRGVMLLLVFSGWLFLSTFVSPDIGETQSEWFRTYFRSLIIFLMSVYFIDDERSLSQFTLTLVFSALALIVVRFYQYHTEGPTLLRLVTGGMFGDPNDLAAVIIMALPFAVVPAFKTGAFVPKLLAIFFVAVSLLLIWYAQSRGAMLALTVQLLAAATLLKAKTSWLRTLLLIGVLGGGFIFAVRGITRDAQEMQESSDSRIMYWKAAVNMALHRPLWGVGFDRYPDTYNAYSSGERYEWGKRTAHSSWLLVLAESGFIGGFLFASFFLMVLWIAWQNRQAWPDQFLSLVGYGVVMTFLSHTYVFYFYLLAGLILASNSLKRTTSLAR
jgi:putative inorganic carbon (hco3(-)) transporter